MTERVPGKQTLPQELRPAGSGVGPPPLPDSVIPSVDTPKLGAPQTQNGEAARIYADALRKVFESSEKIRRLAGVDEGGNRLP